MAEGRQQNLKEWLNQLDLGQYNDKFTNLGISTVGQLREFGLDDSFLNDLGISMIGHRRRILENVPVGCATANAEEPSDVFEDNIYENVEHSQTPQMCRSSSKIIVDGSHSNEQEEETYVNFNADSFSEVRSRQEKSRENSETEETKRKPVPRPRLSKLNKMKKEQQEKQKSEVLESIPQSPLTNESIPQSSLTNESIPQNPPTNVSIPQISVTCQNITESTSALPKQNDQRNIGNPPVTATWNDESNGFPFLDTATSESRQVLHLSGITNDDSSTDNFDPFAVDHRKQDQDHAQTSHQFSNDLLNVFEADSKALRPSGFTDSFVNSCTDRLSNNYGALWESSSQNVRKDSDTSPFTPPFLPNPCHAEFEFKNKNSEEVISSKNESQSQDRSCVKDQKHIYENDDSLNGEESPPPPTFPPPSLPEDFPPVPPRQTSGNLFLKASHCKQTDEEELYSDKYIQKGLFTSSKLKTLTSTSGPDPFAGDDPFRDFDFQQECQNFNQPISDSASQSDKSSVGGLSNAEGFSDSLFDPFEIYELQRTEDVNDPLDRVPPPPDWHETVQPPKTNVSVPDYSVYSVAAPLQQDNSSDNDTSDGDISDPSSPDDINQGVITPSVDVILPSPTPRKIKQKSGYLWKQGGVKANRGWRKRWVVFDGRTLRYYPNHKSQISKRVIPLACMQRIEICVKDKSTDRFKFNLINQNRTFLFAAETLNECTLWANTLMEAIINYERPESGEKEGLDMCEADKVGFIRFERNKELFVAIKNGKLAYYDSHQDYKIGSPLNEIDMKLASVKEVGRNKLQLSTHYGHFILLFNERSDCLHWKMAIEDAIADGLGDNSVLNCVRENESNKFCADCRAQDPQWASVNMGVVLCKNCAGIHRDFDVRVSRVKSLRMDTTIWTPSLIEMMKGIGNDNANRFWESRLQSVHSINTDSSPVLRKQYIQDKYFNKLWIDKHPLSGTELNKVLLQTVVTEDLFQTMRIIFSGANILYTDSNSGATAFELAKDAGQRLQTEFLYHNGGDRTSRASADIDEALALRLRAEITMEGHLLKTGPRNRNAFVDRYCVIEHGCLRYFVNEKSSTARDSIDNESMLCVQAVVNIEKSVGNSHLNRVRQLSVRRSLRPDPVKRYPNAFEISTTKANNRTYLFAATTQEEKMTWMRTLTKLFCPIHFIKEMHDKEFSLAGNFYIKAGVASEWQKTWILVDKKVVKYINDEQRLQELDLRKVSNIQYAEHVAGQPCQFAIESGKCFTIDIPGRSLYFQGDLIRDTERLYEAFGTSMKGGGPTIEDQQLTPENVPVIVHKCLKYIEDNGLRDEGVYRLAAQDSKIQGLLQRFLSDAHSLSLNSGQYTVNEVANCLKRFFRQLKDPLFTRAGYQDWIKCASKSNVESKLSFYKFQLGQLPLVNRCTVKKLILHLASLSTYSAENKMHVQNIATVFCSTLLKGSVEMIHQENLPLEMKVIEDLIVHHGVLFEEEVKKIEKSANMMEEVQKRIREAEMAHLNSSLNITQIDQMKITIHLHHKVMQSCDYTATRDGSVRDAIEALKKKFRLSQGQWVMFEVVYSEVLERPLHPSECLLDVVMSWSSWAEEYSKNAHLVLKSADKLLQLDEVYDPNHALFAEFKYKEKKEKFKKYSFGFNQSKLSLFKDLGYNTQPSKSWQIEDIVVYFGGDPKKNAQKYAFSFYAKGERVGRGDMPLFGRCVCCTTENELISWMAAMLKAKHPDGYLT